MKTKISFLILFLLLPVSHKSQAKATSDGKQFVYNVSLGAVVGVIGAIINKKPEQKFDIVIYKGLAQGALGGYLTFESKRIVRAAERNNDWKLLWCAKFVNAGGVSIKENAAANINFWEKWHINFGFNRIEFETKDNFKVNYKVMPVALAYTIGVAAQTKFEINKTLQSGELIFSSNSNRFLETNSLGVTYPGSIVLFSPEKNNINILSHEIIHLYQSNDFSQIEAYLDKPIKSINNSSELMNKINKYIHYDFRYIPQLIFYRVENKNAVFYYDNFYEREAAHFSDTFDPFILK